MKDPFPIPPIPALSQAVQPLADYLGFATLPLHIHEVLITAAFYAFTGLVLSPYLSSRLFPSSYNSLNRRTKLNWDVHVVSLVQSTTINALALWVYFTDKELRSMDWQERLWGYDGAAAMIQAFAAGYFVWDLIITVLNINIFGLGMLAHAVCALSVYSFGFRPFVNFYSTNFILWELSSPFLNVHWFCDKMGMTGSSLQLYNGMMLIGTFFSCRLIWGIYNSVCVSIDLWKGVNYGPNPLLLVSSAVDVAAEKLTDDLPISYHETMTFVSENTSVPLWLAGVYIAANWILNSLNAYWFTKMIEAIRKRFDGDGKKVDSQKPHKSYAAAVKEDDTKGATTATHYDNTAPTQLKPRDRSHSIMDGEQGDQPPPT